MTKAETAGFSLKKCLPSDQIQMDLMRSSLIMRTLLPLTEKGHSVWSIACSWHGGLFQNAIYYSNSQRASQ